MQYIAGRVGAKRIFDQSIETALRLLLHASPSKLYLARSRILLPTVVLLRSPPGGQTGPFPPQKKQLPFQLVVYEWELVLEVRNFVSHV